MAKGMEKNSESKNTTINEQDMIERYIYEVTKRVSQDMREEIKLELQSLIEDMRTEEEISVSEILQKLGSPAEFAGRYKEGPNHLIGPEYYDHFIWVIKIVFIGIAISAVVSATVQGITGISSNDSIFSVFLGTFLGELTETLINGTISMIGMVTIIFAILERQKVKVALKPEETWTPEMLSPVPDKKAVISRSDSVISIIFITVFAALLIFVPEVFGAFRYEDKRVSSIACIFNLDAWDRILPLFIISLFVGLIDEIIRLVTGVYCKVVMYSSIICSGAQAVIAVILFKVMPLWNLEFTQKVLDYMGKSEFAEGDMLRFFGQSGFNNFLLLCICAISFLEIGVSVYKTLKYAKN